MENTGRTFRDLLRTEPYLFTGGVYDPLGAQLAERAGMKSIYLSGYSMAMANGWPDMGFLTQTEVTRIASMVASAVGIPIIADADDGYGNALSTIRTVQEYVKTGVAGIHLEDQVFPKRCGHIAGKTIVPFEEALGKYRAAVDTRNRLDRDFVLIARTDAYGAVGGSLEEAIRRGRAYADAGVDLVWAELSNAAREPAIAQIDLEAARDLDQIEATVIVEPAVLGRHECARDEPRQLVEPDPRLIVTRPCGELADIRGRRLGGDDAVM